VDARSARAVSVLRARLLSLRYFRSRSIQRPGAMLRKVTVTVLSVAFAPRGDGGVRRKVP
jgi:hypothetical protein